MKKLFLTLLALVTFVACEKAEVNPTSVPSKYDFAFDENGECYSQSESGINSDEFFEKVVGYGWRVESVHAILSDGTISTRDWWLDNVGASLPLPYFMDEKNFKSFSINSALSPGYDAGFYFSQYEFCDSKIYFSGSQRYTYNILEVDSQYMTCIKVDGGGYILVVYKRLTDEELLKIQEKYTINWAEQ